MHAPSPAEPGSTAPGAGIAFLYDVDNTLLDNDRIKDDADAQLHKLLGDTWSTVFWDIYEEVRHQEDVVDIPEAVRRFENQCTDPHVCMGVRQVFEKIDFPSYVYPGALDTLRYTAGLGTNVILSDGDPVFQRRKIEKSGIAAAAAGHILIYIHKEQHVDEIQAQFPAGRYILIDDKPRILKAMPGLFGPRLCTVFVCQGRYAQDPAARAGLNPALTLAHIADLRHYTAADFEAGHFAVQGECPPDA